MNAMNDLLAGRKHVIPPHVQANRMQRYSLYLLIAAFLLVGLNYPSLSMSSVLWFAAGLCAAFGLLCATAVIILHGLAWNFDRLRDEWAGRRSSQDVGDPEAGLPRTMRHSSAGDLPEPPKDLPGMTEQ
jgi:hypothetical protein